MSNTTDILLVCFDEGNKVKELVKATGIDLTLISDGELASGPKILTITAHGGCHKHLNAKDISHLVYEFLNVPFEWPELAVLVISDDSTDLSSITKAREHAHR